MSDRKFTEEQLCAINARGGSVLVSAAAGSGKTTVLIERILRLMTDPEHPVDADRLLVCTFTRASTAEMRQRLDRELSRRIAAEPDNRWLRRQKLLLQKSHITTIHAFCLGCLREYFSAAGVAPDFRMADDSELTVIRSEILSDITDECYESMDDDLRSLMELLSDNRGNTSLDRVILAVDAFLSAYPDPEEKLAGLAEVYRTRQSPERTPWGSFLLSYCRDCLDYLLRLNARMTDDAAGNPALSDTYPAAFEKDRALIAELRRLAEQGCWDELRIGLKNAAFSTLPRTPSGTEGKERLQNDRKYIKEMITKRLSAVISAGADEFEEDARLIAPTVERLCGLVARYRAAFAEKKRARRLMDCNDLEYFTARLLFERSGDHYIRRQAAREMSQRFEEILIDEYQDTNYTQDLIFRSISREEGDIIGDGTNMFMVGDIKQSIYGFRKAVPALFLDRLERYTPYDPDAPVFPAKIILDKNFRSRPEVTDTVNFVFSQLMTPARGGIDYSDGQQLTCAGSFPECPDRVSELHLLTLPSHAESTDGTGAAGETGESAAESRDQYEAAYCASLISRMISEGFGVTDTDADGNKIIRPARYGDFCVMRRTVGGEHGAAFSEKLSEAGIPVRVGTDTGFFDTPEISVMLSLLRAVNNPLLDIPLAAALRSPIFGFDTDRLARLRAGGTGRSLYSCLVKAASDGDALCRDTLDTLSALRDLSATMPADRLIMRILRSTGFLSAVQVSENGDERKNNLLRLLSCARSFESYGFKGLPRFIRTVDRMIETGEDLPGTARTASDNCVTVRTMHGAKGLEFPICIIAGLGSEQNAEAKKGRVLLSGSLGIGVSGFDADKRLRYSNIQRDAVALSRFSEETDEELRVLYVTMTRASEKLIMLATAGAGTTPEKRLSAAAKAVFSDGIDAFALGLSPSPAKWLTACALRLPEQDGLRACAGLDEDCALSTGAPLKIVIPGSALSAVTDASAQEEQSTAAVTVEQIKALSPDPGLLSAVSERLAYKYPYDTLRYVPMKVTASGAVKHFGGHYSAVRPAFLESDGLTAAQKGTALHRFLQLCDLAAARTDSEGEIVRLTETGGLSERQAAAIDRAAVAKFFEAASALLDSADEIRREWMFSVTLKENLLRYFTEYSSMGEQIVLEGECDLLLLRGKSATIIDYKTDRGVDAAQLAERYLPQLTMYASAVKQSFDVDEINCLLYSFALGRLIPLEIVDEI